MSETTQDPHGRQLWSFSTLKTIYSFGHLVTEEKTFFSSTSPLSNINSHYFVHKILLTVCTFWCPLMNHQKAVQLRFSTLQGFGVFVIMRKERIKLYITISLHFLAITMFFLVTHVYLQGYVSKFCLCLVSLQIIITAVSFSTVDTAVPLSSMEHLSVFQLLVLVCSPQLHCFTALVMVEPWRPGLWEFTILPSSQICRFLWTVAVVSSTQSVPSPAPFVFNKAIWLWFSARFLSLSCRLSRVYSVLIWCLGLLIFGSVSLLFWFSCFWMLDLALDFRCLILDLDKKGVWILDVDLSLPIWRFLPTGLSSHSYNSKLSLNWALFSLILTWCPCVSWCSLYLPDPEISGTTISWFLLFLILDASHFNSAWFMPSQLSTKRITFFI